MSVETKPVLQVELGELYLTIDEKNPIVRLVKLIPPPGTWYKDSYNTYWTPAWLVCKVPPNNHLIKLLRIP